MRVVHFIAIISIAVTHPAANGQAFTLKKDDVVVFMGGTNMLHQQQTGILESMLTKAFSSARPRFRDLSWEADTVYRQGTVIDRWRRKAHGGGEAFGDLTGQFKRVGATVVIAQFGQLESLDGPQRLDAFVKAYERLVDSIGKRTRLIVLVTPTPFERPQKATIPDLSKRNDDLARYVKAIETIAAKRKLVFVDLFANVDGGLTNNGIHVSPKAQASVAKEIARQLGVNTNLDESLRRAIVEKHRLWYDYWRPANWKLLYGDDSRRVFTRGGKNYVPFREEWKELVPMIARAEERVWTMASGGDDPGHNRPKPEVLHGDPNANIENEIASFTVPDGFKVNLFASDKDGLTSPLAIRWDPAGRAYVTVTTAYPHVFPGDAPNDRIIMLEDTDHDGVAEKSTVFADGLNIPTGLELGEGGVYVGQNTEMLFLKDTDGDGKADERQVLLSGFGNGDSHQTINTFVWSPDGQMFFGQGDGCESRVETPWGASNLFQAGFYRLRPRRLQLHPLLDDFMGPGNPWGVGFNEWGQIFSIDGAGGVTFLSPGQIPTTHRLKISTIGKPGGYCGIGYLDGRHLPKSMHGHFVVGDYKANRVKRFSVQSNGSGYRLHWEQPILQSRHRNFRPVDVKVGPDGAIYVVDWYNPITCHQEDAYRDPRRDKAHGRIWRISSNAPKIKPPNLTEEPIDEVLDALKSPEYWTRYQAKRALTQRDTDEVAGELGKWVESLDQKDAQFEQHLFQALGAYATLEVVEPKLLNKLLNANEPDARAFATRMVGRWHDRLENPLRLLAQSVADEHPRARMEAVIACAHIQSPQSITVAARVADLPMDRWIDYAFTQAVHHLKPHWSPAFDHGELAFAQPKHLAAVLNKAGGRNAMDSLKRIVSSKDASPRSRQSAIAAILSLGGPKELRDYGLNPDRFKASGNYDADSHAKALANLIRIAKNRGTRPAGNLGESLNRLMDRKHPALHASAIRLAGIWNVDAARDNMIAAASNATLSVEVRSASFSALSQMKLPSARAILVAHAKAPNPPAIRSAATAAMVRIDLNDAATLAVQLFRDSTAHSTDTLNAFLNRRAGADALASALRTNKPTPKVAEDLVRSLYATGRSSPVLADVLNRAIGASGKVPEYSERFVKQLVAESMKHGDGKRGEAIFKSSACVSCHRVGDTSGGGPIIGPELAAIGNTLSPDRIVEELLWPNRQVKEGYSVIQVTTALGEVHQGYERRTRQSERTGDVVLRELNADRLITIRKDDIDIKRAAGSPMPTGLTALLTRQQMQDLIRYLCELGKQK